VVMHFVSSNVVWLDLPKATFIKEILPNCLRTLHM
jgi:hypothetical protein